jgi:hypothetical protein
MLSEILNVSLKLKATTWGMFYIAVPSVDRRALALCETRKVLIHQLRIEPCHIERREPRWGGGKRAIGRPRPDRMQSNPVEVL